MRMPEPNNNVLSRRTEIVSDLRRILPAECVIAEEEELRAYECDSLTAYRRLPLIVVLPETTEQVSDVLNIATAKGLRLCRGGRHVVIRRCVAACRWDYARPGEV